MNYQNLLQMYDQETIFGLVCNYTSLYEIMTKILTVRNC